MTGTDVVLPCRPSSYAPIVSMEIASSIAADFWLDWNSGAAPATIDVHEGVHTLLISS